jgi:hypothetical protein
MNMFNPDQMPASPQPNTSDSQVNGRNPTSALTTVAVRINAASPAPSSTPSIAKTIPVKGNWAARNHHGTPIAASRQGQLSYLAATRQRVARTGHPSAARSEVTTSSIEPVDE